MKHHASSVLAAACAVLLAACGGGSGGAAAGGGSGGGTVSGAVVKGPVLGATVCAYSITGGAKGAKIAVTAAAGASGSIVGGCYVTSADGSYDFILPAGAAGDILLEASGGAYCSNEAQIAANACAGGGSILNLGATVLSSAVNVPANGNATVYVTPLTTAAVNAAAGAGFSAASFNSQFNTLAGQVIGAGTGVTAATAPTTANQPYLAQLATFVQGGGALSSAIGNLQQGSTNFQSGGGTTPATVHASLVGNHSLFFYKGGGEGCGSVCSYAEGQAVTVHVGANGDLTLPGKVLSNPFYRSYGGTPHLPEVIWLDAAENVEYALSDNSSGTFNEINVGDASRKQNGTDMPTFLGQIRGAQNNGIAAVQQFAGTYTPAWQYNGAAVAWTSVTIGSDGSISFAGAGPNLAAGQIKEVYDRVNCCGRVDVEADFDLNGDGAIDGADKISLFKAGSSLRSISYNALSDDIGVRVTGAGDPPIQPLPAHDGTAIPATNAINGSLDGSNLFAGGNAFVNGSSVGFTLSMEAAGGGIWHIRVMPDATLVPGTYDCHRENGKEIYVVAKQSSSAPDLTTVAGGRCRITVTRFVVAGFTVEEAEGTFVAEVMNAANQGIPAKTVQNGVFRYVKP